MNVKQNKYRINNYGKARGIYAVRYNVIAKLSTCRICIDLFPLCGVGMMVINNYEIKPLDFNPQFTFEQ